MFQVNRVELFKGRPCQIPVFLVDCDGKPLLTAGLQAICIRVQLEDDSFIERAAATGMIWGYDVPTAMYVFNFTAEETARFKTCTQKDLGIKLTFPTCVVKHQFKNFLTVSEDLF